MLRARTWLIAASLLTGGRALAQDQGTFQPPIHDPDTGVAYSAVNGVVALADQITLGGVVASFGKGFGQDPRPLFGYELGLSAFYGAGSLETGLAPAFGGPSLSLDLWVATITPTLKLRPLDERDNGLVGLTLYAGATLGFTNLGTTNALGTVRRGSAQLGGSAGGVLSLRITEWVTVLGFGGVSALGYFGVDDPTSVVAPVFGGNVQVHLTKTFTLDLGAMLGALLPRDDEDAAGVTVINLGVTWGDEG